MYRVAGWCHVAGHPLKIPTCSANNKEAPIEQTLLHSLQVSSRAMRVETNSWTRRPSSVVEATRTTQMLRALRSLQTRGIHRLDVPGEH